MRISRIGVATEGGKTVVTADIDSFVLRFEFAGPVRVQDPASAVLACCLYPAMSRGEPLTLDARYRVSARLMRNLDAFQQIYGQWYSLRPVPVTAQSEESPSAGTEVGTMFSGGVDSFYTFLRHEATITDVLLCGGLDIQTFEQDRWIDTHNRLRTLALQRGKNFIAVWSNIRELSPASGVGRLHGQFLAALGILLGWRRTLIPASHSYSELAPWGSHPLTDPLIATESTTTVHDGPARRSAKTALIASDRLLLDVLRVCNRRSSYNCGECEKCLRTMVTLRILGIRSSTLPELSSLGAIRRLRIFDDSVLTFWEDIHEYSLEMGASEVAATTGRVCRGYRVRRALREILRDARGRGTSTVELLQATGSRDPGGS